VSELSDVKKISQTFLNGIYCFKSNLRAHARKIFSERGGMGAHCDKKKW